MQIKILPHSSKAPFTILSEPTADQILISLDKDCVVIFSDGSTFPNPGIGGAGLVIQDPSLPNWLELEFPIQGITTNIGCEIEGMRQAIEYVSNNYRHYTDRVIILSDCKFAVNAVLNKWDSDIYNFPVMECQRLLNTFDEQNVPEIYWIKGHSGIAGNEKVDAVAKRARQKAQDMQPNLFQRPHKSASFLNRHGLSPWFTNDWNRHWVNEGNENPVHKTPKKYLPNLIEAQSFEKIVLHSLSVSERRIICRLITGKVGLNQYLHIIKRSDSPYCKWCVDKEETVEHFLLECSQHQSLRSSLWTSIHNLLPDTLLLSLSVKHLVVGDKTWRPDIHANVVKATAKFVIETNRKI
jgi:ribonuclease HI